MNPLIANSNCTIQLRAGPRLPNLAPEDEAERRSRYVSIFKCAHVWKLWVPFSSRQAEQSQQYNYWPEHN